MQMSRGERARALWCYQATRRHFMRQAGLAMAVAVMTPWVMPVCAGAETDASVLRPYVGCYTTAKRNGRGQGIATYDVNPRDGQWRLLQITPTDPNRHTWSLIGAAAHFIRCTATGHWCRFIALRTAASSPCWGNMTPGVSTVCTSCCRLMSASRWWRTTPRVRWRSSPGSPPGRCNPVPNSWN